MELQRVKDNEHSRYKRENPLARQRKFLTTYLADNEDKFIEAMDDIFAHDKKSFAKLYIEMQKATLPKEQSNSITLNVSKDMESLMLLGRAGGSGQLLDSQPVEDADFADMNRGIAEMEAGKKEKDLKRKEEKASLPLPPIP